MDSPGPAPPGDLRAVILVEGASDKAALETLARRRGLDLGRAGLGVVAMQGATNIGRFLGRFGPAGLGLAVAGLYDAAEERHFARALERAGLASAGLPRTGHGSPQNDSALLTGTGLTGTGLSNAGLTSAGLEALGFYCCHADLEDELIRAVGVTGVEHVIAAQGDLGSLRTFYKQPAQQGRPRHSQLRRFMGTTSGRKSQYARLLVEAVDLSQVPAPLDRVLARLP
jgi:hypothetical protein